MKSIWTIMLNVLACIGGAMLRIVRAAGKCMLAMWRTVSRGVPAAECVPALLRALRRAVYRAFKAVLVCVIATAMWLPLCLSADTAMAADGANSSSETSAKPAGASANPSANSAANPSAGDSSVSADSNLSALQDSSNSTAFVTRENPFAKDSAPSAPYAPSSLYSSSSNLSSNPLLNAFRLLKSRGSSPLERAAKEAQAQAQNREAQERSGERDSYEVYHPGCGKDYARGECFTVEGDGAGARATNGHDLDVNAKGYMHNSGTVNGAVDYPRGHYENGPVPEDPSGTNHFGKTYFTPYPRGTYIMKRLRDMTISPQGNGMDVYKLPLDDVADFVFVKRTPKLSGGGFVWDIIFNMGGRTQGAADALNYFTVPKGQTLDKGSEGGRQYIQRVLYTGREETAMYKKEVKHIANPPRETCSFSWDNPNGLCSKEVKSSDFAPGDDLTAAWDKMSGSDDSQNGNYSRLLPQSISSDDLNSDKVIGSCRDGSGLVCISSSSYAAPDDGVHKIAPKTEGSYGRGYSPAYMAIVKNLYKSIETDTQRVFSFVNEVHKESGDYEVPYTYKIHFTTSTQPGHENDSFFYAAGSYYGRRNNTAFYGRTDPFGNNSKYSLISFGRNRGKYMYTTMYQQWYGAPRIMDVQAPRWHFLKGTGLGPYNSNNGNYLSNYGITFSSVLLNLVNKPLYDSPAIQVNDNIRLLPDYYSPNNGYARGNQWFRTPGVGDHNTVDSTPGRHKLQLKYSNDYYRISETQDLWYRIITQTDVFKPLQTEEWIDDKTSPTAPKYYNYDKPLPNPKTFVQFVKNRAHLYKQVMAFDPNLFLPVNTNMYGTNIKYGSVRQDSGKTTAYPIDETYKDSKDNDANDNLRKNAVYNVEWTDQWGEQLRKNTLEDADVKIAAKVPVVSVLNPCAHSKILDEHKDEMNRDRSASNGDRSAVDASMRSANTERSADVENRDAATSACWPTPQDATKRNIWYISNAPKNAKQGDELTDADKQDVIKKINRQYGTWMRNKYSAQLQTQSNGKPVEPTVLPKVVFVKYAKITFWDNSTTVIPVVFAYVDYEDPKLDVKVSVNNGDAEEVPEDGMRIAVGSKIKFWVKGHDDTKILLGVMKPDTVKKYVGDKFRNDFKMINDPKVDEDDDPDHKGGGHFKTIDYDDFNHGSNMPHTDKDQEGWVLKKDLEKDNNPAQGSPTVKDQDQSDGIHDLIFHGWDAAGNSVFKKIRLIIVSKDYGLPNVWWDKRTKEVGNNVDKNGRRDTSKDYKYYVGRVKPWDGDKRVRSIMVRIWPRGKNKPVVDPVLSKKHKSFDEKCPSDGSCYGIIIQRDGLGKPWHQVNTDGIGNKPKLVGSRRARSVDEDRAALEDRDSAGDKAADGKSADGKAADNKSADSKDKDKSKADGKEKADDKSTGDKAADGKAAGGKAKVDNKAKADSEKTDNAKSGENSTQNQQKPKEQQPQKQQNQSQNQQKQENKQEQQIPQNQANNKPASLKISKELKKNAKNKTAKKRNVSGRRGKVRFAVLKENENKSTDSKLENKQSADQKTDQKPSENVANSEAKNVPNKNVPNNGNEKQNKAGDTNASTGVNKDVKKRSKRSTQNKGGKDGETSKDRDDNAKEDAEKRDRDTDDDRAAGNPSDEKLKEKYSKRVITDLRGKIPGCDPAKAPDGSCEITFDSQTGDITIPEYFAEIGSRIYVDAGITGDTAKAMDEVKTSLWQLTGVSEESDPLPLKITWPNGLVQVSPYELNDAEKGALLTWMRHDPKNYRLFVYREEEIGIKGEDKYDTYNEYDKSSSKFTYAQGDGKPKYSCKAEGKHSSDLQWKLCLDGVMGPRKITTDINDIPKMEYAKKTLVFEKLETSDKTELNPVMNKVTRFVDMRKDYTWELKGTKVGGRESDPGLEMRGNQQYGTQYLVYKWNINTGKRLNTDAVLNLIKGVPKAQDPNKPQPSLSKVLDGSKNKHDILYGPEGNGGWDGKLPIRGLSFGYAPNDGTCTPGGYSDDNVGKCQWENVLDLVKYTPDEHGGNRGSFADNVDVNMIDETEVPITDKLIDAGTKDERSEYTIRKDFLMPGGKYFNGQADNENIGDIITENKGVNSVNDYDNVPYVPGEGDQKAAERYFNKRPFMHAQLFVRNGLIMNDLLLRNNDFDKNDVIQDVTTNVINVWFMPVDGKKPTISAKKYDKNGKPWNIHGDCLMNQNNHGQCGLRSGEDPLDLDRVWYNPAYKRDSYGSVDNATIHLIDNLKLDDDFNAYDKTIQPESKYENDEPKPKEGKSSKVLEDNLRVKILVCKSTGGNSYNCDGAKSLEFVKRGKEYIKSLQRFIESNRGNKPGDTIFKMVASTTDSAGKNSDETAVGCFRVTWKEAPGPSVVAYDGNTHDKPTTEKNWLYQNEGANTSELNNGVLVQPSQQMYGREYAAKRMVIYFHPRKKYTVAASSANGGANGSTGGSNEHSYDIGKKIVMCWRHKGPAIGRKYWLPCDGYDPAKEIRGWHGEDKYNTKGPGIYIDASNGDVRFTPNYLEPGSVVRARSRTGWYAGPWSQMPGLRDVEDSDDNQDARTGEKSGNVRSNGKDRDAGNTVDLAKQEDDDNVLPMELAKEKPSEVCRPDNVSVDAWSAGHHPSDCVYFGVAMHRRIVQVHPMLLSGDEKHAIKTELHKENGSGNWIKSDSEVTSNDEIALSPGQAMVTFKENDYDTSHNPHVAKPNNFPEDNYGGRAGNIQDVAVLTRGWRSRVLVPLPRIKQITRFARLRAPENFDNKNSDKDKAADYLVTWDKKHPYVNDRKDDPGFMLSPDGKSLFYLFNLGTKAPFTLNDLQYGIVLKPNTVRLEKECGKGYNLYDCQPSLREVKGSGKVDGEYKENNVIVGQNGYKMIENNFYVYTPEGGGAGDTGGAGGAGGAAGAANSAGAAGGNAAPIGDSEHNTSHLTAYVNIIDMTSANWRGDGSGLSGGGDHITGGDGRTYGTNDSIDETSFKGIAAWGSSGAIATGRNDFHITKNDKVFAAPQSTQLMTLGDSWVNKTLLDTRGRDKAKYNAEGDSTDEAAMRVYVIPVDNVGPTVAATAGSLLSGHTDANNPYVVAMDENDYSKLTVEGNPLEYDKDGKVSKSESKDKNKTLFADVHDDYDSFSRLSDLSLYACKVKKAGGATDFDSCTSITGSNGSVDAAAFKTLKDAKAADGGGVEYALYGRAKDKSDNESYGFSDNDGKGHLVGYFSFGYLVRPVPLPFTGGQAAIWFSFMFGVLFALFLASGAFGRRGWLGSVLSGYGFGSLTDSKHCDASVEALRSGKLFKWLRL